MSPEVGELDEAELARQLDADPDAALAMLADLTTATDEALRAHARRLAARLILDRSRVGKPVSRGIGRRRLVPASRGGDLDLDASFDAVVTAAAEDRPAHLDDMLASDWGSPSLALCLLVDDSGSMTGARLAASAMVTAACALRAPAEHAVLAFARDVRPVRRLADVMPAETVVERVLRLRGHGVTSLATALRAAAETLGSSRASRRVVVLLSDCRATDDEDPVPAAAAIPELLIIAPRDDTEEAAALADASGARWATMDTVDAAVTVLNDLLS
ncbi:MAG: vWA domain-containing protein [Jatrophihabitans sp.]